MGIGAKVAIGAVALFGAYATSNEVLGDTGIVNHPAMGRFTAKKTIEYWMRDVEKEKALIDRMFNFMNKLIKFELNSNDPVAAQQQFLKAQNEVVEKNKNLIPNIKIDVYSANNSSLTLSSENAFLEELQVLKNLMFYKSIFVGIKKNLAKMKLSEYSLGELKFDLSKNNVLIKLSFFKSINPSLPDNVLFTLNENGSLTIKQSAKQLNLPYGKSVNNFTSQFTIPDPTSV